MKRLEYKWLVAIVLVVGLFMDILDATIVNVAIPTFGEEFEAPPTTIEWVVTGYLLSLAVWIPASGWIGDRFGTKRIFLGALATFTLSSALCGTAWNVQSLIGFRFLQGVAGGMLTPVGSAMLFRAFPPSERAKASAILAIPTIIAPAAGPLLGGLLVTHASWRWIFFINLPVGVAGFAFGAAFLREHREPKPGRFDVPGFVFSGAGLALILYALARGPGHGWLHPGTLLPAVLGVISAVLLVVVELRRPDPMLDLRLFSDRMFRQANIAMTALIASMMGVLFLLPLFLQHLRGLDALHSGLVTVPQALGTLMAVGLMMLPATAARFWASEVWSLALVAASIAMLSGFVGLLCSYHAQWPSGPAIVLVAGAAYVLSLLVGSREGLLWQALRRREQEVLELQQQVARNQRLASLVTLAAGAAHELSTPLATMALVTSELAEDYPRDRYPHLHENLELLRSQIRKPDWAD